MSDDIDLLEAVAVMESHGLEPELDISDPSANLSLNYVGCRKVYEQLHEAGYPEKAERLRWTARSELSDRARDLAEEHFGTRDIRLL